MLMAEQDYKLLRLPIERERPKGLLYHYTSLEGLLGIIESQSIRATHIRYLNDRSELRNAFENRYVEIFTDSINTIYSKYFNSDWFEEMRRYGEKYDRFLVSFTDDDAASKEDSSRAGDRLSQWRAYAKSSGGFSLGFEYEEILADFKRSRPKGTGGNIRVFRCSYGTLEKETIAKDIGKYSADYFSRFRAEKGAAFVEENHRKPDDSEEESINRQAAIKMVAASFAHYSLAASSFKNEAFSEEHEWRIVFVAKREDLLSKHTENPTNPIIRFRSAKLGVIPYMEFPLSLATQSSPLRRIVVGPTPHKEEAVNAVKLLLESKCIKVKTDGSQDGVEVVPSSIPYRDW
jgi:hypothetical protein